MAVLTWCETPLAPPAPPLAGGAVHVRATLAPWPANLPGVENLDTITAQSVAEDLAALRAGKVAQPGPRCSVENAVASIREDEGEDVATVVAAAVDDRSMAPAALVDYLEAKFGIRVAPGALRRHRRRLVNNPDTCRCPK